MNTEDDSTTGRACAGELIEWVEAPICLCFPNRLILCTVCKVRVSGMCVVARRKEFGCSRVTVRYGRRSAHNERASTRQRGVRLNPSARPPCAAHSGTHAKANARLPEDLPVIFPVNKKYTMRASEHIQGRNTDG